MKRWCALLASLVLLTACQPEVTPEETIVEFRVIDTLNPNAEATTHARFRVVNGIPGIETLA